MRLKEIEEEVYEEEADSQVLEEEAAAKERVETAIVEKVEEQTGTTASLKVSPAVLWNAVKSVHQLKELSSACIALYAQCTMALCTVQCTLCIHSLPAGCVQ